MRTRGGRGEKGRLDAVRERTAGYGRGMGGCIGIRWFIKVKKEGQNRRGEEQMMRGRRDSDTGNVGWRVFEREFCL